MIFTKYKYKARTEYLGLNQNPNIQKWPDGVLISYYDNARTNSFFFATTFGSESGYRLAAFYVVVDLMVLNFKFIEILLDGLDIAYR